MRIEHILLRLASRIVPPPLRADWLAEWNGELYVALQGSINPLTFTLGAFPDAIWLRRNHPRTASRKWLQSPFECAAILGALAILALVCAPLPDKRHPYLVHLGILGYSFLLVPIATTLSLGEYPPGVAPFRRWFFLIFKVACLIVIVYGLMAAVGAAPIRPHGLLVGYILALRWALTDQRNRCPVCLRRLTNPTSFGWSSQVLLEWYGTELICPNGHGLLHVPELLASSFSAQSWVRLDPSWKSLFAEPPPSR